MTTAPERTPVEATWTTETARVALRELRSAVWEAFAAHEYSTALVLVRQALTGYLHSDDPVAGRSPIGTLLGSRYARLAAAFEDASTLDLMERAFERLECGNAGVDYSRMKFPEAMAGYREDLDSMKALRATIDASPSGVAVSELNTVTDRVKSRLAWMEKVGTVHLTGGKAYSAESVVNALPGVPKLRSYYSSLTDLQTDEQKRFFEEFSLSVKAGAPLELDGNLSYAFILIREAVVGRDRSSGYLEQILQLFAQTHADNSLGSYARAWYADLAFLVSDFDDGYKRFGARGPGIELYVNIASLVEDTRVTPAMVDGWLGKANTLTPYGKKRKRDVAAQLSVVLADLHEEHGRSVVMDMWARLMVDRPRGEPAPFLEPEFGGFLSQEQLNTRLAAADEAWGRNMYESPHVAFAGMPGVTAQIYWPKPWVGAYWFKWIVQERLRALYRQAENAVREAEGLKAVGEGWVSEVALLNELREAFPQEHIVHQGRPRWLGSQSIDIYFPHGRVAVEYQGLQHSEPVERFGGAIAFIRQQERDSRKRALCAEHGVTLIEVHPGYEIGDIIRSIEGALS